MTSDVVKHCPFVALQNRHGEPTGGQTTPHSSVLHATDRVSLSAAGHSFPPFEAGTSTTNFDI
jgi:hypothetical protein